MSQLTKKWDKTKMFKNTLRERENTQVFITYMQKTTQYYWTYNT